MKYFKYLNYLFWHKWYVMLECFDEGLYWRGIIHDLSKFMPNEFFPYMSFFYGKKEEIEQSEVGYFKSLKTGNDKYDRACFIHEKRNMHHWQWWIQSNGEALEIEEPYLTEMICDWVGAAKAQGHFSPDVDKYFMV